MIVHFKNGNFDLSDGDLIVVKIGQDKCNSYTTIVKCVEFDGITYQEFGDEWNYKFNSFLDIFVKKIKLPNK